MSLLLSCQGLSKAFGSRSLFQDISFGIFKGDKIGLIGPNGSGKSTLLKILALLEEPNLGSVTGNRSLRVGYVPQETDFPDITVHDVVLEALDSHFHLSPEDKHLQATIALSKLGFTDFSKNASHLSGGWKKRLAIARESVKVPDILFLDEPTNHLDLEGILWLEKFLENAPFAYVVISHDRYFLENITNRMMELNKSYPKGLFSVEGSYLNFLEKREEFLTGQVQQERSLSSKVRREIEWLKQNPKARTTKSQSRIQEANRLIQDLGEIKGRNKTSRNQIDFSSTARQTQKFIVATNAGKSMGERLLFSHLNFTLSPGTRLGIAGLNGSGKTTLLRLLAGELQPDQGTIKYADQVKIVYFDQHRAQLADDISLRRALSPSGDTIIYRGRSIHVNGWCKRFLFSPDRLDLPFGQLSGGEKARVHIARLMLQPADVLLLDEPTNDLDIETLEILEESLQDFPGAVVLISHDRYMLDQIATVILGLGTGSDSQLFADYRQWEQFQAEQQTKEKTPIEAKQAPEKKEKRDQSKKMNYAEKREWDQMEQKILSLEEEIGHLQQQIQSASATQLSTVCQALDGKQQELEKLYQRWAELEEKLS